mmetsp:Transcript_60276/g.194097  ORF Transcript_60276/g.194097 Transcript_60276/m.194097 type:complete len:173 (-) Transcript_60276:123-641(-)
MAKTAKGMMMDSEAYDAILYVSKDRLEELTKKLKDGKGDEITQKCVEGLMYPEDLDDEKLLVPVDISGEGEDFPMEAEGLVKKEGAKAAVEAIVRSAELFEKDKGKYKEDERPIAMTVGEWLAEIAVDDEGEDGEEEEQEESEEEDGEDNEDGGEDEAAEQAAPAAKKRKTS